MLDHKNLALLDLKYCLVEVGKAKTTCFCCDRCRSWIIGAEFIRLSGKSGRINSKVSVCFYGKCSVLLM